MGVRLLPCTRVCPWHINVDQQWQHLSLSRSLSLSVSLISCRKWGLDVKHLLHYSRKIKFIHSFIFSLFLFLFVFLPATLQSDSMVNILTVVSQVKGRKSCKEENSINKSKNDECQDTSMVPICPDKDPMIVNTPSAGSFLKNKLIIVSKRLI